METHQKDIEEKDPFGQNRADDDEAGNDEKSFLKALLAERALKNQVEGSFQARGKTIKSQFQSIFKTFIKTFKVLSFKGFVSKASKIYQEIAKLLLLRYYFLIKMRASIALDGISIDADLDKVAYFKTNATQTEAIFQVRPIS